MFGLEGIARCLDQLAKLTGRPGVRQARDAFSKAIPGLKGVRDSAHNDDERALGKARGKPVVPQPINNPMIHAPEGGVIVTSALNETKLSYTGADGHLHEVDTTEASVTAAQTAIQQAADALVWTGGRRTWPL